MVKYKFIGSGVTDENGVARMTKNAQGESVEGYVGIGAGELDIVASLDNPITSSSIVSETYNVLDCTRMDKGIKDDPQTHDIWSTNTTSSAIIVSRTNEYTEFREAVEGGAFSNAVSGLSDSCCIEMDFYQVDGSDASFMTLQNSNSMGIYSGGIRIEFTGGSAGNWYHLKLVMKDGVLTVYNETTGQSTSKNLTDVPFKFAFWSSGNITAFRFKNFLLYPI